jgi:hypothetical protein
MSMLQHRRLAVLGWLVLAATAARANDFPTVDRVLYVQECMRNHPGAYYEMVNKCACALDALAGQIGYDDYVSMTTAVNANSIGGERGGTIRDSPALQAEIRRWRTLQAGVEAGCFLAPAKAR